MSETAVAISNRAPIQRQAQAGANQQNVSDTERLVSAVAGGLLAVYGLRNLPEGLPLTLLGGYLAYRGATGHCNIYEALGINAATDPQPVKVERTVTVNMDPASVYRFWRDFENLPRFMRHLEDVQVLDERRSHWVAKGPANTRVEWDAEIFLEKENELIAWRALPDAQVKNAGTVRFRPANGGRGCEVKVEMAYVPPAGQIGLVVARLFGEEPGQQVNDDLHHLKMVLEAGEIATNATRPEQQKDWQKQISEEVGR